MVIVQYHPHFLKLFQKIRDALLKEKIRKQMAKIVHNPEIGKPMQFDRKDTRELYIKPYRLSYAYIKAEEKVIFLDIYHKDEQ
ncbi:type II toxin-antitoxin system RelE/ParE family toxin [Candidatus Woesearchaeota archaeon]|nr:type II toxin-antitoxin system RelE/ParE family toxin [Candidatus Woesearchaeota archaeon]